MKKPEVHYYPETDTMWVVLSDRPSVESAEVAENVIVALSEDGEPVAIEFLGPVSEIFADLIERAVQPKSKQRRAS